MFDNVLVLTRLLRKVWLYRAIAACAAVVVAAAGWWITVTMDDVYRADSRMFVDTTSMIHRLLDGVALDSSEVEAEFLRIARRSLLSRPNLDRVAKAAGLDTEIETPAQRERLHQFLSDRIRIEGESTTARGPENLFTLVFEHSNPEVALKVVKEVHAVFLETILGLSDRDAQRTDTFLERQITHYEQRLEEAEERRKRFRQENAGLLPGEGQDYFGMLQRARDRLREAELDLTRAERVRDDLRRQLGVIVDEDGTSPFLPDSLLPGSIEQVNRIRELERRLQDLLLDYTDQHPDVIAARRQLERALAAAPEGIDRTLADPSQSSDRFRAQDLQIELALAQAAVASEQATAEEYRRRMAELESAVNTMPEVEAEMIRLNRDYDILRRQYEELVSRREAVLMGREADRVAEDGLFQVVDPPHVTNRPVGPPRPFMATVTLGGAFAAAGGFAFFLSLAWPTYGDVGELRNRTGLHVLGRVTKVRSRAEKLRRWLGIVAIGIAVAALLAVYITLLVRFA